MEKKETFESKLNELSEMYISAIRSLENDGREHGAYFKPHNGSNWLVFWGEDDGFLGEPMCDCNGTYNGWFCWEFENNGEFNHSEPMLYKDLHWCINKLKGIV